MKREGINPTAQTRAQHIARVANIAYLNLASSLVQQHPNMLDCCDLIQHASQAAEIADKFEGGVVHQSRLKDCNARIAAHSGRGNLNNGPHTPPPPPPTDQFVEMGKSQQGEVLARLRLQLLVRVERSPPPHVPAASLPCVQGLPCVHAQPPDPRHSQRIIPSRDLARAFVTWLYNAVCCCRKRPQGRGRLGTRPDSRNERQEGKKWRTGSINCDFTRRTSNF